MLPLCLMVNNMNIVKYFLVFLLLLPPSAYSCSCAPYRTLPEIIKSANTVFYGTITEAKKIGTIVESGSFQEYEITVTPNRTLKGNTNVQYKFFGTAIYNDPESEVMVSGGCNLDMTLGKKVIVMYENGSTMRWSMCSDNILIEGTGDFDLFPKEYEKARTEKVSE